MGVSDLSLAFALTVLPWPCLACALRLSSRLPSTECSLTAGVPYVVPRAFRHERGRLCVALGGGGFAGLRRARSPQNERRSHGLTETRRRDDVG
jgi:hypothetical protein